MTNIDLKDFDRTKHTTLNGCPTDPHDLFMIEQLTHTEEDNHERNFSQKWKIVFRASFDDAEIKSMLNSHFRYFSECGWYQRVSEPNIDGHFTVHGALDI
jgi:hypothetical protein